jgi:serine protease Do
LDARRTPRRVCGVAVLAIAVLLWAAAAGLPRTAAAQTSSIVPGAPGSFSDLVAKVRDSVVNISTMKIVRGRNFHMFRGPMEENDPFHDFFERFFRDQIPKEHRQKSLGSGFIIEEEGFILTNNHVVEKTDEIKVVLADGGEYDAEIIGRDPKTDLALIKIEPDGRLGALPLGDSDALKVGDWVVAIGNPFGLESTVTAGIVSAKYRRIGTDSYANFIQTDASINPGNSGGPLLNTAGEVVGINSAIFSRSGGSIGIGFAVPVNLAKELLPQLKRGEVVRGWLGVMIQQITPELQEKLDLEEQQGALVADVTPGGPADKAGIRRGDVIVGFDGKEVREMSELPLMVGSTPVGKEVAVEVIRNGRKEAIEVTLGRLDEEAAGPEPAEARTDLGMTVEESTPETARRFDLDREQGVVVVRVEPGSAAAEAGIRPGDQILEIDQKAVRDLSDYQKRISRYQEGDTILFLVRRGGNTLYLTVKVWK